MKILQTTVERLLYFLLFLVFIGIFLVGIIAYNDGQQIKKILKYHSYEITLQEKQTKIIESNQHTNSNAIKEYIACLLAIKPNNDVSSQEQTCFDNAPNIK